MNIEKLIDRTAAVRFADNPNKAIKQRVAEKAEDLSLAGKLAERLAIANEGIFKLTQLVYHADTDGKPANIDHRTGMILIPVTWGSAGYRHYQLRRTEAELIRMILLGRQRQLEKMSAADRAKYPQLFYYSPEWGKWFTNIDDYPSFEQAQQWLKPGPLTLQEWRKAVELTSEKRRKG